MNYENNRFPRVAKDGIQAYATYISKRYELMDQVLQCIKDGNEFQALALFRERNSLQLPGRIDDELTEWKYELVQMKALLILTLRSVMVPDITIDSLQTQCTKAIYYADSTDKCQKLAEDMIVYSCKLKKESSEQTYSSLVQKVIIAVDMDLGQKLTLQYFSNLLNVNDSYLSNLFRKETGVTLTDYVTKKRVEKAQYLLATTENPIKFIAKQVGIEDVHYFSRIFKKYENVTPSEYRTQKRKTKDIK